jgi:hypothetical protein
MHWDSKLLLICSPKERSPYYEPFFSFQKGWPYKRGSIVLSFNVMLAIRISTSRLPIQRGDYCTKKIQLYVNLQGIDHTWLWSLLIEHTCDLFSLSTHVISSHWAHMWSLLIEHTCDLFSLSLFYLASHEENLFEFIHKYFVNWWGEIFF